MNLNRRIIIMLVIISLMFLSLIVYLSYFTMFQATETAAKPLNRRITGYEENIVRGSILDRNGAILAVSPDKTSRLYPYKNLYSHVIGYNSLIYQKSRLEAQYNDFLNGKDEIATLFNFITPEYGFDLQLTIDHELQQLAHDQLGNRNGAIVALDPNTGEILAMVSKPDFDPNDSALESNWSALTENESSPLLSRTTGGLYAPGSVFKIITSAAAIEKGLEKQIFNDTGTLNVGGKEFKNAGGVAHGKLTLKEAFAKSSNYAFCTLGTQLADSELRTMSEKFGFNKPQNFDLSTETSVFPEKNMTDTDRAASAIGQWEILATPLQMAVVGSIIANGGNEVTPYLLDNAVTRSSGTVFKHYQEAELNRVISQTTANTIRDMMIETVKSGTGRNAAINGITVAGKTGTSENERKNQNHAWFVCFAPAENPKIALAIVLEYSGGSGGDLAAPIAKRIMEKWLTGK